MSDTGGGPWRDGDDLLVRGHYRPAREAFDAVRERLQADWTGTHEVAFRIRMASICHKQGRYAEALVHCGHGIASQPPPPQRVRLHAWGALALLSAGRVASAWNEIRAGQRCEGAADPLGVTLLARAEGNALCAGGHWRRAIESYERSLESAERVDEPWELSIARFNLGDAYSTLGLHGKARAHLEESRREKLKIKDRWGLAYVHRALARLHLDRGELAAAAQDVEAGLRLGQQIGDPKICAALEVDAGRILLLQGDGDGAAKRAEDASQLARECGSTTEELLALVLQGFVLLERRDARGAAMNASRVTREVAQLEHAGEHVMAYCLSALAHLGLGNHRDARRAVSTARPLVSAQGNPYRKLELDIVSLEVDIAQRAPSAREHLDLARERAAALSARLSMDRCDILDARLLELAAAARLEEDEDEEEDEDDEA